jgi:TolA-binding protein
MTAIDGSVHRPRVQRPEADDTPAWSTPPWLSDRASNEPNPSPQPSQRPPTPTVEDDDSMFGPSSRASIENVALRMQRIKASAAAVRDAVASEVHDVERARAQRPAAPPPQAERVLARPAPAAEPHAASPHPARAHESPPMAFRAPAPVEHAHPAEARPRELIPHRPDAPHSTASGSFMADDFDPDDDGFFEGTDDEDDGYDDDFDSMAEGGMSGFGDVITSKPLPWRAIGMGAGVVAVAGLVTLGIMVSGPNESDTPDDAGEVADEDPGAAQVAGAQPEPAPAAEQPVQPEPAPGGTDAAEDAPPAPLPLDDAMRERLEHARDLYDGASGGSRRKKLDEAREILQEILAKHPNQAEGLLLMAQVLLEQGDAEASLTTATKCTTVAPQQADCWLTIGVLEQENKNKTEAVSAYEKYLALAPDGRYAGEVQKQLNRLR